MKYASLMPAPIRSPKRRIPCRPGLLSLIATAIVMGGSTWPTAALAQVMAEDISQAPLYVSSQVEPNIMFILDDSGSMHYEITPDDYRAAGRTNGDVRFVFPRPAGVYGGSDYANTVSTVDDNAAYNALTRSPQVNKTYYNPSVTYTPWAKHDGSLYPSASASCAPHNPENTGSCPSGGTSVNAYARNLTVNNSNYQSPSWRTCTSATSCSSTTNSKTFWPATYFWHNGGSVWSWSNYTKVEIKSTTPNYSGHGRENRSDCTGGVCTYAQEIQNFANWYTYYRSRVLAARAGIGRAFAQQGESMRVGYGAINKASSSVDGVNTSTIVRGVRPFTGADREAFFTELYGRTIPNAGTPLRGALDDAGKYFSRTDNRGPWGAVPGNNNSSPHLECRQSFTILMTDGYYSDGPSSVTGNIDDTAGPIITAPDGSTYQYTAADPYKDEYSGTLADIAMYYWRTDLRSDLANRVPTGLQNPAFWQHMVTFGVGFGVTGSVDESDAWAAVESGSSINWPDPADSNPAKLDDLLHAGINSRGGFFSAQNPEEFAAGLGNTLASIVSRARSSVNRMATSSVFLNTGSRVYQASFDSSDWSGRLVSYLPEEDGDGALDIDADWDAASELPAPASRNILSHAGGAGNGRGITFTWASGGLTDDQKALLGSAAVLNYLRGDRTGEGTTYRTRGSVLGDIINSDPVYVHQQNLGYNTLSGTEGSSYRNFVQTTKATRAPVVYVGANDGMLHAFHAEEGTELFAYVPNAVYPNLAALADPQYTHHYYVDGGITVTDAYFGGGWKTVLVGSLGAGGNSIYALDVTNPGSMTASKVLWEFTDADMGYTFGRPLVARLQNGAWAAIFGNGYGSASGKAVLYVVNLADGSLISKVETGVAGNNGLSGPTGYNTTDRSNLHALGFYAGDLLGNLWKFTMDGTCATGAGNCNWKVAYGSGTNLPLFTARNASGQVQPITVTPALRVHQKGGYMVLFGTGRFFAAGDAEDRSVQSVYGIWDKLQAIAETDRSTLQQQTITHQVIIDDFNARAISNSRVDWSSKRGWYLDLVPPAIAPATAGVAEGERVIRAPEVWFERLRVSTYVPSSDPCSATGYSWYMEIDLRTGGRLDYPVFGPPMYIPGTNIPVSGIAVPGGVPATIGDYLITDPEQNEWTGYDSGLDEEDEGRQSWRAAQ
ncbi:pilus assembly protein [Pseudothauera rhizosphaerae]|nr:PilC/PilY family type IV pilus protein [Pseudothauera rhizosphaerae]